VTAAAAAIVESEVLRQEVIADLEAGLAANDRIVWPSARYRDNPAAFFREVLGVEPWSRQLEVIEAVRTHRRVAVKSGHKVSKSNTAAGLALWFYCSFPDAQVVMSSTTARQVDQILWRELKMMFARSGRCTSCKAEDPEGKRIERPCPHSAVVDGEHGELARTGLKSGDFRQVVGFTAREAEAVAGVSGRHLLYIVDEASGVPNAIFEAIEGNRAGGAWLLMLGNPTRTSGEFFDAFYSKKELYKTVSISSEETPNVVEGRVVVPGLATREWIEEKRQEWGEGSPLYLVRVKGEYALSEDGKIFSIAVIAEAEQRWHETPASGRLFIGLDPAGETGSGDETCFAPRRGLRLLQLITERGLDDEAHVARLLHLVFTLRLPGETPVVVMDREGSIGAKLAARLRAIADTHPSPFELVAVRASDKALRQPHVYDRVRDELAANLEAWFREGGSIPEDTKLEAELHALQWIQSAAARGRLKVTSKPEVRKLLEGRSPDRYDGLALSVWEPLSLHEGELPPSAQGRVDGGSTVDLDGGPAAGLDPYASMSPFGRRR
jgi:hypothetical protein